LAISEKSFLRRLKMDILDLEKLIKGRRSIREWKRQEVPDELLKKAVEFATWAPNGGNYQGWRFIIVKRKETIEKMANAVQAVSDKIASWPEAISWQEDVKRYQKNASFFRNAPVCMGVFSGGYQSPMDKVLKARESFDPEAKEILGFRRSAPTAVQSTAAVAMMLLAFHQMGLGAVWLVSPIQAKKEIEAILNVPSNMDLICLIAVGYPDESPQKERRPVEEVLEFVH
jgi:nitroreductase